MGAAIFAANEELENKGKKMKRNTIKGPAGPTNGTMPIQKSVVTGISSAIFLNQIDRTTFGEGSQLEKVTGNCYSAGTIQEIFVEKGKLKVRMDPFISGCGHPPSDWGVDHNVELVIDLEDHDFAYIGSGDNGGGSRLFLRSKYHLHDGEQIITLYPPDGKLLNVITIDTLQVMHRRGGWGSFTVMPPSSGRPSWETNYRLYPLPNVSFNASQDY